MPTNNGTYYEFKLKKKYKTQQPTMIHSKVTTNTKQKIPHKLTTQLLLQWQTDNKHKMKQLKWYAQITFRDKGQNLRVFNGHNFLQLLPLNPFRSWKMCKKAIRTVVKKATSPRKMNNTGTSSNLLKAANN